MSIVSYASHFDYRLLNYIVPKVEATQVSTSGCMDNLNVVYTDSRIVFSPKEGNSDTCNNMSEP